MNTPKNTPTVVVVGGGFAGIEVVKTLEHAPVPLELILVSKTDTFEYHPGLYKLVTGALPIEASVPLHTIFPGKKVKFVQAAFTGVDRARRVIMLTDANGVASELGYDYLVLALGSETNFFNIEGLPEHSFSFKSVAEALRLKRHFCELFAKAKDLTKEQLVARLHVLIVGAGPSGVELAGDLRHYLRRVAREFGVDPGLVTIDLIEAASRVLPMMSEKVSKVAEARLRTMGVNIFVNRALERQEVEEVIMKDMQMDSDTVIWTAGTRINSAYAAIPGVTFDAKKRVEVSPMLTLPADDRVFIAGDGAATVYSGLAQSAIHHGIFIGRAIASLVKGKAPRAYKPEQPSYVVPIGTGWAIFVYGNFVMTGFLPWLLRSAADFRYFTSILPIRHIISIFRKGRKYRKVHGGCSLDEVSS